MDKDIKDRETYYLEILNEDITDDGDDNCPNCGKEYDEIDKEYQICHHCIFNNQQNK